MDDMLLGIQRQQEAVKTGMTTTTTSTPTTAIQTPEKAPVLVTPESALALHQQLINFFSAAPNQVAGEEAVTGLLATLQQWQPGRFKGLSGPQVEHKQTSGAQTAEETPLPKDQAAWEHA
eukprot:6173449-Karenia_brevis.AAC.1